MWQKKKDEMNEEYPSPEFEAYCIQIIAQRLIEGYKKEKGED